MVKKCSLYAVTSALWNADMRCLSRVDYSSVSAVDKYLDCLPLLPSVVLYQTTAGLCYPRSRGRICYEPALASHSSTISPVLPPSLPPTLSPLHLPPLQLLCLHCFLPSTTQPNTIAIAFFDRSRDLTIMRGLH